jgi:hypothetical protein
MRAYNEPSSWVVYRVAAAGNEVAAIAMCNQADWPDVERIATGRNTLIRGNIMNETEAEAELVARRNSDGLSEVWLRRYLRGPKQDSRS